MIAEILDTSVPGTVSRSAQLMLCAAGRRPGQARHWRSCGSSSGEPELGVTALLLLTAVVRLVWIRRGRPRLGIRRQTPNRRSTTATTPR